MNEELLRQMISALKVKNDLLNGQVVQLTLLTEHLYEKLSAAEENGLALNLELDKYEEWVTNRMDTLQKEIDKNNLDEIEKNIETQINEVASQINLSESE